MIGTNSSATGPGRALRVAMGAHPRESLVWTWFAVAGLLGAVTLAIVGVPTIDLHGPVHYAGIMDPFCGATRSVYLTMHGRWQAAFRYNPGAPLFLLTAAALVLRGTAGWLTGRWVQLRLPRRATIVLGVAVVMALEVRQQSNAALLIAPWTGS